MENCNYCENAKKYLKEREIGFNEIKKTDINMEIIKETQEKLEYRTFPMIFIEKKFIGGYSDLIKLKKDGKRSLLGV